MYNIFNNRFNNYVNSSDKKLLIYNQDTLLKKNQVVRLHNKFDWQSLNRLDSLGNSTDKRFVKIMAYQQNAEPYQKIQEIN